VPYNAEGANSAHCSPNTSLSDSDYYTHLAYSGFPDFTKSLISQFHYKKNTFRAHAVAKHVSSIDRALESSVVFTKLSSCLCMLFGVCDTATGMSPFLGRR